MLRDETRLLQSGTNRLPRRCKGGELGRPVGRVISSPEPPHSSPIRRAESDATHQTGVKRAMHLWAGKMTNEGTEPCSGS